MLKSMWLELTMILFKGLKRNLKVLKNFIPGQTYARLNMDRGRGGGFNRPVKAQRFAVESTVIWDIIHLTLFNQPKTVAFIKLNFYTSNKLLIKFSSEPKSCYFSTLQTGVRIYLTVGAWARDSCEHF